MSRRWHKSGISICPSESEIELYVLTRNPVTPATDLFGSHVENCPICRAVYQEYCIYYDTLLFSLSKPVSNQVIDLVLSTTAYAGRAAIFALRQISPTSFGKRRRYFCELLLDTGSNGCHRSLTSFNPDMLENSDLALRAYLPADCQHLLFFLWAEQPQNVKNVQMEFNELGKVCTTNRCGIAMLAQTTLEELDGQVVHTTMCESSNGHLASRSRKLSTLLALWEEQR